MNPQSAMLSPLAMRVAASEAMPLPWPISRMTLVARVASPPAPLGVT